MSIKLSDEPALRRNLLRQVNDVLKVFRRQLRRLITHPRGMLDDARYRAAVRRRDWSGLRAMLRPLSQSALRGDKRLLVELGYAALRLDEPQLGVELLHAARSAQAEPSDWQGEELRDGTLVIRMMETANQGVAVGVPLGGHVRAAAARAAHAVLVVEPRMVPLFQRTLPEIKVVAFGTDLAPHIRGTVRYAAVDDLRFLLGFDAATIARLRVPLVADPKQTQILRERYLRGRTVPLIGISWWSSHYGKDLPSLAHWSRLIRAIPAQFISLQYGDVTKDIAALSAGDPQWLLADHSIDQMSDMDGFASQIAALDLVVSISNSGAHLAGALGQRMILVRDDLFRRNWPYLSRSVPWYPGTTVIGKDGRPWDVAFDEIVATAKAELSTADR